MSIKVSVIVPIYNVEEFLERAVNSLLCQTLEDIEIILVDDGSPDNCPAIIDSYKKDNPKIVAIHKENGGLSDARHAGMAVATGEYIGFIDPDDYAEPDMFEKMYLSAKDNNADIIFCGYKEYFSPDYCDLHSVDDLKTLTNVSEILNHAICGGLGAYAWSKLYKSSVIKDNNLAFPKGISVTEDTIFFFSFLQCTKSFSVADGYLYNYIRQPKSICANYQPGRFEFYKRGAQSIEKTVKFFNPDNIDILLEKNNDHLLDSLLDTIDVQNGVKNRVSLPKRYKEMCRLISDKVFLDLIEKYGSRFDKKHRKTQIKLIKNKKKTSLFINEFFNMRILARVKYYLNIGG